MRRLLLVLLPLVLLTGCAKHGEVGETLQARAITARLIATDTKTEPGTLAVDVGLCNRYGGTVTPQQFLLELDDDTFVQPRWPFVGRSPEFESDQRGCTRGWIVYVLPQGTKAKALDYSCDCWDGTRQRPGNSNTREHDHFVWKL